MPAVGRTFKTVHGRQLAHDGAAKVGKARGIAAFVRPRMLGDVGRGAPIFTAQRRISTGKFSAQKALAGVASSITARNSSGPLSAQGISAFCAAGRIAFQAPSPFQ